MAETYYLTIAWKHISNLNKMYGTGKIKFAGEQSDYETGRHRKCKSAQGDDAFHDRP